MKTFLENVNLLNLLVIIILGIAVILQIIKGIDSEVIVSGLIGFLGHSAMTNLTTNKE